MTSWWLAILKMLHTYPGWTPAALVFLAVFDHTSKHSCMSRTCFGPESRSTRGHVHQLWLAWSGEKWKASEVICFWDIFPINTSEILRKLQIQHKIIFQGSAGYMCFHFVSQIHENHGFLLAASSQPQKIHCVEKGTEPPPASANVLENSLGKDHFARLPIHGGFLK